MTDVIRNALAFAILTTAVVLGFSATLIIQVEYTQTYLILASLTALVVFPVIAVPFGLLAVRVGGSRGREVAS